jgi:hypothetical protein
MDSVIRDAIDYLKMANQGNLIAELVHELHTEDPTLLKQMKKEIDFRIKRLEMVYKSKDGRQILLKDLPNRHLANVIKCALRGFDGQNNPVIHSSKAAQAYAMEFKYRNLDTALVKEYFEPEWALTMMEESWIVNTEHRFAAARASQSLLIEPEPVKSTLAS